MILKMYRTYYTNDESDLLTLDELFYMVKNYQLVEIVLDNDLYIRQWKDLDVQMILNGKTIDVKYGNVYLTDGKNLLDIRTGRGENDLKDFIKKCDKIKYDRNNFYNLK